MEPSTIAVAAVSFIALEIAAGGLKEIGKDIYGKVKEALKPDEIIKLDLLEKYPESRELKGEVAEVLTKRLEAKPELVKELDELLKKANVPASSTNINIQQGKTNINVQNSPSSEVKFNEK
jgi:hypothetical protein